MLLTVSRVWLGFATPPSDDRAVVLLPLTVSRETHIITVADLCLLLLKIILRLRRVQIRASFGNGWDRR